MFNESNSFVKCLFVNNRSSNNNNAYNKEIPPPGIIPFLIAPLTLFKPSLIRSYFSLTWTSDIQQTRIIATQPCIQKSRTLVS